VGESTEHGCLWKLELQREQSEKIEHRMYYHITGNWRGRPLLSRRAVVELIAATTTEKGPTIQAEVDERIYETGRKVTDQEMASLRDRPLRISRRVELSPLASRVGLINFLDFPAPTP
jgi:hypothetical protein